MLANLRKDINKFASKDKAKILARFFKTGTGNYGEGDKFLGITVPQTRIVAKKYKDLTLRNLDILLESKFHEERLLALLILVNQFEKGSKNKPKIFKFYLSHTKYINNWDLVDLSADKIVGAYLKDKPKDILPKLAKSKNLWERRIAIIATFHFIKKGQSKYTLKIAKILLKDDQDLIHKSVGWMLREVGKRCSEENLTDFLDQYAHLMPRTMLRYAIERFGESKRKKYISIKPQNLEASAK